MLKAIETPYSGYRFRSRLEARWAGFFDALRVKWEYEKEGYELGPSGRYLPDFWLPNHERWIEIKGDTPSLEETNKAYRLHEQGDLPVWIVAGTPGDERIWLCDQEIIPVQNTIPLWSTLFDSEPGFISAAYRAARAMRFEHGEVGLVVPVAPLAGKRVPIDVSDLFGARS